MHDALFANKNGLERIDSVLERMVNNSSTLPEYQKTAFLIALHSGSSQLKSLKLN